MKCHHVVKAGLVLIMYSWGWSWTHGPPTTISLVLGYGHVSVHLATLYILGITNGSKNKSQRKYPKTGENKDTTQQNLRDTLKTVLVSKFTGKMLLFATEKDWAFGRRSTAAHLLECARLGSVLSTEKDLKRMNYLHISKSNKKGAKLKASRRKKLQRVS